MLGIRVLVETPADEWVEQESAGILRMLVHFEIGRGRIVGCVRVEVVGEEKQVVGHALLVQVLDNRIGDGFRAVLILIGSSFDIDAGQLVELVVLVVVEALIEVEAAVSANEPRKPAV